MELPEARVRPVTIPGAGELVVIAIGKAAIAMAAGAQDLFGARFRRGFVLKPCVIIDQSVLDNRWTVYRASHPIPDQRGIDATRALIEIVESSKTDDIVVARSSPVEGPRFSRLHAHR